MHAPRKQAEEPSLSVLPELADLSESEQEQQIIFDGGGGPPNQPLMKDAGGLWVIFAFGVILASISLFALSNDPATVTFRQTLTPTFGDFRIYCEWSLLVIGTGCIFPSLMCLRALHQAKKIEKGAEGRVKSMRSKKLEKISDDSILGIMGSYIAALLGLV